VNKLYGLRFSAGTRKVIWALEEAGRPFELIPVDVTKGDQRKPEFLALNPNGTIPTLVDDEGPLWECNAILLHLADRVEALAPANARTRSETAQWLFWEITSLGDSLHRAWLQKFFAARGRPLDAEEHERQVRAAEKPLGVLDAWLKDRPYVVGERFGVADIACGASVAQSAMAEISLTRYPAVARWFSRVSSRPAYARIEGAEA